ncbi:MAG: hypothetical protein AAF628_27335 [Planctomycetota bacterium]
MMNPARRGALALGSVVTLVAGYALPAQTWIRTYDHGVFERASRVLPTADGGCVIVAELAAGARQLSMMRLDEGGNVVWEVQTGLANDLKVRGAHLDGNGDVLLGGEHAGAPWLAKAEAATGQLVWQKEVRQVAGSFAAIEATADGSFLAAGRLKRRGLDQDFFAVKFDDDGFLIWELTYGDVAAHDEALDVLSTQDGGLVLAGTTDRNGNGTDLWLLKIDRDGRPQWTQSIGEPTDDGIFGVWVVETTSGDLVVVSAQDESGPFTQDVWVVRLTEGGAVVWERFLDHTHDVPAGVVASADDGCVVAAASTGAGSDTWLVGLNAAGAIAWQMDYGDPGRDEPFALSRAADDGLWVVGRTNDGSPSGVRVLRLNPAGGLDCPCPIGAPIAVQSVTRSPSGVFPTVATRLVLVNEEQPTRHQVKPSQAQHVALCATNVTPWINLGGALAGTNGAPHLAGVGAHAPQGYTAFLLADARAGAPAVLVAGATRADVPVFGGSLVPSPQVFVAPLATDAIGRLRLEGKWPNGVPPGAPLFLQALVLDFAAPQGFAFSNGVVVQAGGR